GKRATGVWPTTSPSPVASRMVHVVAEIMLEVGRSAAIHAEAEAASKARPSHSRTPSAVVGPAACGSAIASSTDRAPVQRLNAGASLAMENRIATHIE